MKKPLPRFYLVKSEKQNKIGIKDRATKMVAPFSYNSLPLDDEILRLNNGKDTPDRWSWCGKHLSKYFRKY